MKTQAATEYIMIVGFVIVILIPGIYLYMRYSQESQDSVINAKVDSITNEIVKAAEQVYTYGEGSQTTVSVDLPKNIVAISFQNNEIVFTVINSKGGQSEIAKVANVNMLGEIALVPGTTKLNIKSFGDYVSVFVECAGNTKRCGFDFECSKNIEGYQQGWGCLTTCNDNNQWDDYLECNSHNGCNNDVCSACREDDLRCGLKSEDECIENDQCELICRNGNWELKQECSVQAPTCQDGKCTQCQPGQVKCGTQQECESNYPCTMNCGQDNNWAIESSCQLDTPECENGICVQCVSGEKRCDGNQIQNCFNNGWVPGDNCDNFPQTTCQNGECKTGIWYSLTITVSDSNYGYVTKDPNQQTYQANSLVTLTAHPFTGYQFSSWTGEIIGNTVTMNGNKQIIANFAPIGG